MAQISRSRVDPSFRFSQKLERQPPAQGPSALRDHSVEEGRPVDARRAQSVARCGASSRLATCGGWPRTRSHASICRHDLACRRVAGIPSSPGAGGQRRAFERRPPRSPGAGPYGIPLQRRLGASGRVERRAAGLVARGPGQRAASRDRRTTIAKWSVVTHHVRSGEFDRSPPLASSTDRSASRSENRPAIRPAEPNRTIPASQRLVRRRSASSLNIDLLRRCAGPPACPVARSSARGSSAPGQKPLRRHARRRDGIAHLHPAGDGTRRAAAPRRAAQQRRRSASRHGRGALWTRSASTCGVDERGSSGSIPREDSIRARSSRRVLVCAPTTATMSGAMNPVANRSTSRPRRSGRRFPRLEVLRRLGMKREAGANASRSATSSRCTEPFVEQPTKVLSRRSTTDRLLVAARGGAPAAAEARARARVLAGRGLHHAGGSGAARATTAANAVWADVGIGLDVTLACDTPASSTTSASRAMVTASGIMVQDSSMIADHRLVAEPARSRSGRRSRSANDPAQGRAGRRAIQKSGAGAWCAAVVVGTRCIHTVTEQTDKGDLQAAIDLLAAWIAVA